MPILSAAQLANLPAGHVAIVRRGMPPAVGRVQMAWRRRSVRKVRRLLRRMDRYDLWVAARDLAGAWVGDQFRAHETQLRPVLERLGVVLDWDRDRNLDGPGDLA